MIILNPSNTSHVANIPIRNYDLTNTHTFELYDEDKRANISVTLDYKVENLGLISYSLTATLVEGKSYRVKITDDSTSEILYRGKCFATSKSIQNYQY